MGNTGPAFSKSLSTPEGKLQVSFGTPCSGRGSRHTPWLAAQPGSPFSHSHICKDSRACLETLSGPTAWRAQEELSLVLKPAKNSRHSHSCHGSFLLLLCPLSSSWDFGCVHVLVPASAVTPPSLSIRVYPFFSMFCSQLRHEMLFKKLNWIKDYILYCKWNSTPPPNSVVSSLESLADPYVYSTWLSFHVSVIMVTFIMRVSSNN